MAGGRFELLGRYGQTFAQAWRARHQSAALLLSAEEADFSPPALALAERPISPTLRLTALLLIALVLIAVVWATLGRIDIVANATGQVIASGRTKTIASVDTAVVRAIQVKEGDLVKAGAVLVEFDATPLRADFGKATAEEQAAELQRARSRALIDALNAHRFPHLEAIDGVSPEQLHDARMHLSGQYLDFTAKLAQLDTDIERYARALPVANEREQIYANLVKTHDVSRDAWLAKQQERIDLEGHLAEAKDARNGLIAQTRHDAYDALTEASKVAATAREDAVRASSHAAWLTLHAPVDGTVQQLTVHTIGGVVQAAQPLMLIVPAENRVQVQALLENKDVGFVKVGQSATVKITAFDYTKYGTISGRVVSVSRDALEGSETGQDREARHDADTDIQTQGPRYLVRIALDRSAMMVDGHPEVLRPGMAVSVEIKTGRRRLIEYVLSPILRQGSESLHER